MIDKACDACRERRVKCPRGNPCLQCVRADIQCSYIRVGKRKGPNGKVISRLRHQARALPSTAATDYDGLPPHDEAERPAEPSDTWPIAGPSRLPYSDLENYLGFALTSPSSLEPAPRATHWLSPWLAAKSLTLHHLLDDYFDHLHPLRPIINVDSTKRRFLAEEHLYDVQFAALILSLAALSAMASESDTGGADLMITEAIALHNRPTLGNRVDLDSIATSMSIAALVGARYGRAAALLRTREAISLLQLLKLDHPVTYSGLSSEDAAIGLTMLWLLSGRERSAVLFDPQTLVLRKRPSEVSSKVDIQDSDLQSRLSPVLLIYDSLDGQTVDCINGFCSTTDCGHDAARAVHLHRSIDAVNADVALKQIQIADFFITRLWIHIKLWLASLTHSLLFPPVPGSYLDLDYPLRLLEEAKKIVAQLPVSAFQGNGKSMGFKIDHIASIAEAVMSYEPAPGTSATETTQESINSLRRLGRELQDKLQLRREVPDKEPWP